MRKFIAALPKNARSHASQVVNQETPVQQEDLFDGIARLAAGGLSRRKILKLIVSGFTAAMLARLAATRARAAQSNCICDGVGYDSAEQCCTPNGIESNHPIADLSACPHRGTHPGYTPSFNGCGPEGNVLVHFVPNHPLGLADFTPCCNDHDVCYGTCVNDKANCDATFLACMTERCNKFLPQHMNLYKSCLSVANTYFAFVSRAGGSAYNAAQQTACDCCGGGPPPCPSGMGGGGCCPEGFYCCEGVGCCEIGSNGCCVPCPPNYHHCDGLIHCCPDEKRCCGVGSGLCCDPEDTCCGLDACCDKDHLCCRGVCVHKNYKGELGVCCEDMGIVCYPGTHCCVTEGCCSNKAI
jgi:hypothetical protein